MSTSRLRWQYRPGKKATRDRAELAKVKPFLIERSGGACEAACSELCTPERRRPGTEIHHVKKRSAGGSNDLRNLMWVCNPCNGWVENHPDAAYAAGLVTKSWEAE